MNVLEQFINDISHVPPTVRQEYKIIRKLDIELVEIMNEMKSNYTELMNSDAETSREDLQQRLIRLRDLCIKGVDYSNDKVSRTERVYEIIDNQIRRIDSDMTDINRQLFNDEKEARVGVPTTLTIASKFNKNSRIVDMPVDPNEPVYCLCQQVSYGDMVACDNINCPIEWFHFSCVGLTQNPKGKWLCPKCREG